MELNPVLYFNVLIFVSFYCRGAFSIVKRCVQKSSGLEFAAKIINTKKLTARGEFALQFAAVFLYTNLPLNIIDCHLVICSRFSKTRARSPNLSKTAASKYW